MTPCSGRRGPCAAACRYRLPDGECSLWWASVGAHAYRDIAQHFGVTHEAVRLWELAALRKLRRTFARRGLAFEALCPERDARSPAAGWTKNVERAPDLPPVPTVAKPRTAA